MSDAEWLIPLLDEWPGSRTTGVPPELSGLADGVASLRAGDTALAARQFALEWSQRDRATAVLAIHLGFYAEMRSFNYLPNGAGTGAIDVRLRWVARDRASYFQGVARDARSWVTETTSRASRWIEAMAGVWSTAASLRSVREDTEMRHAMFPALVRTLEDADCDAPSLSPSGLGIVHRARAGLAHHAGRTEDAVEELSAARLASENADDECGVLACDALAEDWRLATSSTALVCDLEIDEAPGPTSELKWNVEAREGRRAAPDRDVVRRLDALHLRALALGAPRCAGTIRLLQAFAMSLLGDRDQQIAHCRDAIASFDGDGDKLHGHLARAHLAIAQLTAGGLRDSLATVRAIGTWGRSDGSFSYALGLGLLMTRVARRAALHEGDYEAAEGAFRLARALSDELGSALRTAQSDADLAMLHQSLGNRERARTHLEASLDRLVELANAHADVPEMTQRIALLTQELFADSVAHKDAQGIEAARARIAGLDVEGEGLSSFAVKRLLQTIASQADVLVPLYTGVDHRKRGEDDAAERQFEIALSRAHERNDEGTPFLAIVHATATRYDEALREYNAFLASGGIARGLAGQVLALAQSKEFVQRETAALRRRQAESDLTFYVRVKAYECARKALARIETLADREWWRDDSRPWRSLSDIGETYEGLEILEEAAGYYQLAIDELERRRGRMSRDELRTALAADYGAQYLYFQATRNELARARANRARLANAFALSERGRARALLDLVSANLRRPQSGAESPQLERWRRLTMQGQLWTGLIARLRSSSNADVGEQRAALESQLARSDAELQNVTAELAATMPQFSDAVRGEAEVVPLEELVALLGPRTAMLQYMTLGEELLAWAITRDGVRDATIQRVHATALARATRDFHDACARGDSLESGVGLASQLIAPFESVVADHDHLVIVPYGELHRLPFAALPWRGSYLGAQKALSYVPSATLFATLARAPRRSPSTMLAIGDPADMAEPRFDGGEPQALPALAAARDEADYIATLYGGVSLVGADATLANVRAELPHHRLVHFGTHGLLYPDTPLRSGVALADKGYLALQDLLALRFEADLVTLSACRTGLGVITGGEEIVGLTRGLFAAGARCVVVSLWRVNDVATAVLMRRFYDLLHEGALPSAALREAQAAVRAAKPGDLDRDATPEGPAAAADGCHPKYWAPFVVVGAWSKEGT